MAELNAERGRYWCEIAAQVLRTHELRRVDIWLLNELDVGMVSPHSHYAPMASPQRRCLMRPMHAYCTLCQRCRHMHVHMHKHTVIHICMRS